MLFKYAELSSSGVVVFCCTTLVTRGIANQGFASADFNSELVGSKDDAVLDVVPQIEGVFSLITVRVYLERKHVLSWGTRIGEIGS